MNKQRMIRMLNVADEAIDESKVIVNPSDVTAKQTLIGQLILASAIEESGSSISMSLDKLDGLTLEISEIARAIGNHS